MKLVIASCILLFGILAVVRADDDETDYILMIMFGDKNALKENMMCVLDEGDCSREAKEIKDLIKNALADNCSKCIMYEYLINRIFEYMINRENAYWKKLVAKYDPDKKNAANYEKKFCHSKAC